ncbi:hypothetical protein M0805_005348 [Coniferiporia weirii]|nr:hypothetical protein M0805_005348 [Coniferiporia weirii]
MVSRLRSGTRYKLRRLLARIAHLNLTGKIDDISPVMKAYGGYSDIFTGYCSIVPSDGNGGLKVAIKRLRVHTMGDEKLQKKLVKELYIWTKLDHLYVLPLHGFFFEDNNYPSLVSAWMENGTVLTYLESYPGCDLRQSVLHIAEGIGYLHNNDIIHSDIKPENILISSSGEPRICDFGISRMVAASRTFSFASTTGGIGGTIRYTSTELLNPMDQQFDTYSKASDVWAFGMTVLVLLTKKPPYSHIRNDVGVVSAIMSGGLPAVPEEYSKTWSDPYRYLWALCKRCWASSPSARPSMLTIASDLNVFRHSQAVESTRAPSPTSNSHPPRYSDASLGDRSRENGLSINRSSNLTVSPPPLGGGFNKSFAQPRLPDSVTDMKTVGDPPPVSLRFSHGKHESNHESCALCLHSGDCKLVEPSLCIKCMEMGYRTCKNSMPSAHSPMEPMTDFAFLFELALGNTN